MRNGGLVRECAALATVAALAQCTGTSDKDKVVKQPKPYSPDVDQHFPQRVLFVEQTKRSRASRSVVESLGRSTIVVARRPSGKSQVRE